jgi:hypothetical protein
MELKVNEVSIPEQITFNYEELKQEITEKTAMYETLVYTDDQMKLAKTDKASFNRLKKALNDERIRMEREYMVPFNEFKVKINEIINIIDRPVSVIDRQIKEYEEKQKQDKRQKIEEYFENLQMPEVLEFVKLENIFEARWLNASVSMKSVQDAIHARMEQIYNDWNMLSGLPEFGFEASEIYKSTLDVNKAVSEAHRMSEMAKAKAAKEAEIKAMQEKEVRKREEEDARKKQEEEQKPAPVETPVSDQKEVQRESVSEDGHVKREWVSFRCKLSVEEAKSLKEFFEMMDIEFEPI